MQVLETSSQVGRVSISADSDLPYKEMASHCEALQMGKQQKMLDFMSSQLIQESVASHSCHDLNQAMHMASYSQVGPGLFIVVPYFSMHQCYKIDT